MTEKTIVKKFHKKFPESWIRELVDSRRYFEFQNEVAVIHPARKDLEELPCSIVVSNGVTWHNDCHVYHREEIWSHLLVVDNPGYKVRQWGSTLRNQKYITLNIGKSHKLAKSKDTKDLWVALALDAPEPLPKKKVLGRLYRFLNTPQEEFSIL